MFIIFRTGFLNQNEGPHCDDNYYWDFLAAHLDDKNSCFLFLMHKRR